MEELRQLAGSDAAWIAFAPNSVYLKAGTAAAEAFANTETVLGLGQSWPGPDDEAGDWEVM